MNTRQRNNVKLLGAVIGGSGVVAMGALWVAVAQATGGPGPAGQVSEHERRRDQHRDDAAGGGGHHDGRAGNEGPGATASRRAVARRP